MNSPYARTRLRPEEPDFSRSFNHSSSQFLDRLSLPAVVTAAVVIATLSFNLLRSPTFGRRIQNAATLLWDGIVAITPVLLIHTLDKWMNPPMFPGLPPAAPPSTHEEKSEKMAALLGANKAAGVIRSLSSSFPRPSFSPGAIGSGLLSFGASKDQPAGLGNLDNSCYQNSILQGLASLDHLAPYLDDSLRGRPRGLDTARTLRDLVAKLRGVEYNGRTLWTPGVLKNMCSFMQQDAQEYYSKILDEIDKEVSKAGARSPASSTESVDSLDDTSLHSGDSGYSSSPSLSSKMAGTPTRNPLEGLLAQRVACVRCGFSEGLSLIPFNCLTINLGLGTPGHDLYERLDAYTDLEAIEGVECPRCTLLKLQHLLRTLADRFKQSGGAEDHLARVQDRLSAVDEALEDEVFDDEIMRGKCGVKPENRVNVLKTKQAVVARPPKSLAVHVNRSVFDERTGMLYKNPAAVRFPTTLDLGPWCLGSRGAPGQGLAPGAAAGDGKEGVVGSEEMWGLGPRTSMVAGEKGRSLVSGPMYELRAVVTHYGHHNNGHYICYRKHTASAPPPTLDEKDGVEVKTEKQEDDMQKEEKEAEEAEQMEESEEGDEKDEGATWWRLSDESVRKVPEDVVMAQGGVFMLFYDCVDSTLVRTDEVEGEEGAKETEVEADAEADTEADTLVGEESADVSARGSEGSVDGTEGDSADTLQGSVAGDMKDVEDIPEDNVEAEKGPGSGEAEVEADAADADTPLTVDGDK